VVRKEARLKRADGYFEAARQFVLKQEVVMATRDSQGDIVVRLRPYDAKIVAYCLSYAADQLEKMDTAARAYASIARNLTDELRKETDR
jgi:hypothetical protein